MHAQHHTFQYPKVTPVSGAPAPAAAGTAQSFKLPAGMQAYVAIRAIDDQGNIGLPAVTWEPRRE